MTAFGAQIAVVTGAGSGIGKALALALARDGATVCLVGRRMEKLAAVADSGQGTDAQFHCCPTDLALDDDLQQLVEKVRAMGHVDLLIHSAGFISLGRIESAPVEDLDRHYRVNVRAPYVLTQALLPMLRSRRGQIVFVNSSAGLHAKTNVGQYAATKHALKAIADSLREEVNVDGVRVLTVYPGRTASPMQAAVHDMEGRLYHPQSLLQPEDVAAVVLNALRLPRSAEVTDIHIRPLQKWT
jgi:NADP-dependent 3-hydroxy acid dehydrogenase YdfG